MSQVYRIECTTYLYVVADDMDSAIAATKCDYLHEHLNDSGPAAVQASAVEVSALADVEREWQGALPYGGDDETPIRVLLGGGY